MKSALPLSFILPVYLSLTSPVVTVAQAANAGSAANVVPSLIRYSGILKDAGGRTLTSLTFLLYNS